MSRLQLTPSLCWNERVVCEGGGGRWGQHMRWEGWCVCLPVVDDNVIAKAMWGTFQHYVRQSVRWRGVSCEVQQPALSPGTGGTTKAEVPPIESQSVPSHLKKQTNCNRMSEQFWHETNTLLAVKTVCRVMRYFKLLHIQYDNSSILANHFIIN